MREIWVSNVAGRIPTVSQLLLAISNLGYNRVDALFYGLKVVGGVKTVVCLGESLEPGSSHTRLHAMDSSIDHAKVLLADYGKIPQANALTGEWELVDFPPQENADWNAVTGITQILNKPTIPAAQIQADWNQANTLLLDYIKNKPTLVNTFLHLLDVVATTYATKAKCVPIVLDDESGLDLTPTEELVSVLATFILLADVPNNYVGQGGKFVKVKVDETGLEFV